MAELKRTLGLGACIFFGVGSILGAGIYTIIGKVAGVAGNMIWLSFLLASLTALFTAFSYAELSAAFPKSGGEYEYAKKTFGKGAGAALGTLITLNGIVSGATVSIGFAGYLLTLSGFNTMFSAAAIVAALYMVNVIGIRQSSTVNIIFTLIETSGLLLIIYIAFPSLGKVDVMELPPGGSSGIITAAALAYFAYIGFEEIVKLAEETKNPERNIPRALFVACFIVMVMYTFIAVCVVSVMPYRELAQSPAPLSAIAGKEYGRTGIIVLSLIALFSTSNTILSNMLGSSRVLLHMAKEIKFLERFATVSEKRKTPVAALTLIVLIMVAFTLIGNIETIARIANIFIFITFILVNVCVLVLRVKEKKLERPFRIPVNIKGIPLFPVLGILMTLLLFGFNLYSLLTGKL